MIYGFFHIVLFIIIIEVFFFDVLKTKSNNYLSLFKANWVILGLISALRYGVGPDTPNYMKAYELMPPITELTLFDFVLFRFQPLYTLLNSICKSITNDFTIIQLFQCGLFFTSSYYMMKVLKIRKFYILLFVYLYFYFISGLSAMRESFAISFCFFAFKYYLERRWFVFYVFILIAFGFHTGALVFFILPFFHLFDINKKRNMFIMLIVSLASALVLWKFMNFLGGNSGSSGSIGRYMNTDSASFSILNILKNVIILFILYRSVFFMKKEKGDLIMMATFYVVLDIMVIALIPIMFRITSYYTFMFCYAMCLILSNKNISNAIKIVVVVLFFYQPVARYVNFFTNDIFVNGSGIDPYCSVFSDDKSIYNRYINEAEALDYYNNNGYE